MRITHSYYSTKISGHCLILLLVCFMLSACNPQSDPLSEREARVNARESELVTLFAELVELKKSLEKDQTDKPSTGDDNAGAPKADGCVCENTEASAALKDAGKIDAKTVLGGIEIVHLDPPGLEFSARIDTGAQTSSLNALDIVEFERDGKPFVKFNLIHPQTGEKIELTRRLRRYARVKELGNRESQRRPVVRMRVILADIDEQINFTLENRSRFKHQVLIGRNLLQDLAIVDVSKKPAPVTADNPAAATTK
ncbi:RimK/LysX family protein [Nitrosomonas sp. Is35]|uniref:ATP-dependent zinc protease family protein n=2 Tax=unclassified Nitrosomonas TaxID=2609265 RepID=UPI00294AD6A1|nr:RimK/LysX family protein [Nitrosomonas sp. Is35]MDV6348312.1 RimK/LysX family protein [Nitrosomonas sp. Is35]